MGRPYEEEERNSPLSIEKWSPSKKWFLEKKIRYLKEPLISLFQLKSNIEKSWQLFHRNINISSHLEHSKFQKKPEVVGKYDTTSTYTLRYEY